MAHYNLSQTKACAGMVLRDLSHHEILHIASQYYKFLLSSLRHTFLWCAWVIGGRSPYRFGIATRP